MDFYSSQYYNTVNTYVLGVRQQQLLAARHLKVDELHSMILQTPADIALGAAD